MDFRWICIRSICIPALLMAGVTGCSDSSSFVLYSSLTRLPENPKPVEDWTPKSNSAPQADDTASSVTSTDAPQTAGGSESNTPSTARIGNEGTAEEEPVTAANNTQTPTATVTPKDESPDLSSTEPHEENASGKPLQIKLLIPEKRFRKEGDDDLLRVSYDDIDLLKVLNMEPVPQDAVDYFPDWLNELDGQRIRIRGFMFPHFLATGIKRFALARDNGICCFVKEPKIYDVFEVSLAKNEVTDYIEGKAFDVEGTFRIDPDADDNELFQLYRIEDAKVIR